MKIKRFFLSDMDVQLEYDEEGEFCLSEDVEKLIELNKEMLEALIAERDFDAYCVFENPSLEDRVKAALELGAKREDAIKKAESFNE